MLPHCHEKTRLGCPFVPGGKREPSGTEPPPSLDQPIPPIKRVTGGMNACHLTLRFYSNSRQQSTAAKQRFSPFLFLLSDSSCSLTFAFLCSSASSIFFSPKDQLFHFLFLLSLVPSLLVLKNLLSTSDHPFQILRHRGLTAPLYSTVELDGQSGRRQPQKHKGMAHACQGVGWGVSECCLFL